MKKEFKIFRDDDQSETIQAFAKVLPSFGVELTVEYGEDDGRVILEGKEK